MKPSSKPKRARGISMSENNSSSSCGGGIGIGTVIAILISWNLYHSVLWAAIHGFFGWGYVIYYLLTK